jgi:hypothetical protein
MRTHGVAQTTACANSAINTHPGRKKSFGVCNAQFRFMGVLQTCTIGRLYYVDMLTLEDANRKSSVTCHLRVIDCQHVHL